MPFDEIISFPINILECPVCREVQNGIKYQCKNGHIICDSCYKCLPSFRLCPTCRVVVKELIRNRVVEAALEHVSCECPFKIRGCSSIPLRAGLASHLQKCRYGPVHLCKALGFTSCNFDGFYPNHAISHLKTVHKLHHEDSRILSFDTTYQDLLSYSEIDQINSKFSKNFSSSFLFLTKPDSNLQGVFFLCLYIGPQENCSEFRTAYYFTSANVQKFVVSWPALYFRDAVNRGDLMWDFAFHISSHTLKTVQGNESNINVLIRIREMEMERTLV